MSTSPTPTALPTSSLSSAATLLPLLSRSASSFTSLPPRSLRLCTPLPSSPASSPTTPPRTLSSRASSATSSPSPTHPFTSLRSSPPHRASRLDSLSPRSVPSARSPLRRRLLHPSTTVCSSPHFSLQDSRFDLVESLYKDFLLSGACPDVFTRNLLLHALCAAGRMELARRMLDAMPAKNEFSFGILARGYCRAGRSMDALGILNAMPRMNLVVCNTVVAGFCRESLLDEAERLVEKMRDQGLSPNVVTFNARISALCMAGRVLEAYRIFNDMQEKRDSHIRRLLRDSAKVDHAHRLLKLLMVKGYSFDQVAFMPVIDALSERGKMQDIDMLSGRMMEMAERDDDLAAPSVELKPRRQKHGQDKYHESHWRALLHRYSDDHSY
ncbi:hypothetical protein GUJ93_ZPchr0006g43909 [Zizania palustris]|uniref:Pentatricopeptide repeat-containing protein n=1 Tax=Zizania palustris TaxID=103762 RepID=A0A8J5VQM1_ZIZPA|nr:hypothetical protein GUJ93_ZPchr0006g43909 [Zizania palustris]